MVSYYPVAAMYRHQQAVASAQGGGAHQFHHSGAMHHTWYPPAGYHHQQNPQVASPAPSYCMQDEQPMWHHHSVFHQDYPDLPHHHNGGGGGGGVPLHHHHHHQQMLEPSEPSPPITVSGSEMSSPGAVGGAISPSNHQSRPTTVRSPYEWIKKTTYNSQPNPDAAALNSESVLLDFSVHQENPGKTRTKDKYRVVYTDHQRVELEKEFYYSRYITIRRKAELASNLGLSERQVKIWFQNRRAKERKQVKKREELHHNKDPSLIQPQHAAHQQNSIVPIIPLM